ncbi:uncharacterized protein LOC127741445 isoform X2 [Arachis duranensis]|uniref:Uncharacterized protein LOC127741445 isoform X2 n=2 Tax=Arachis duranensis TaxID=130453 RepID=A0A9C6T4M2_ARADU|nr:uncharacterized protein LOC127741445 isoform X2 [Arachis duranensis]
MYKRAIEVVVGFGSQIAIQFYCISKWSQKIFKKVKGCKIQATVQNTMIYRFKQLLSEGRVYVMKLFSVVPNQGSYRATKHQIKLIFQFRTTVRDAICDFIPKSALTISPFTELLETKEDYDFLVDVVGLFVSVSEEKEYDKDGKKMKMAVMELAENELPSFNFYLFLLLRFFFVFGVFV